MVYGLRYNDVFCRYCIAFHRRCICVLVHVCFYYSFVVTVVLIPLWCFGVIMKSMTVRYTVSLAYVKYHTHTEHS